MRTARGVLAGVLLIIPLGITTSIRTGEAQRTKSVAPKTWDGAAMATLEVPSANPIGSPRDVPADFYYKIPVRPIYRSYPIYAPGHEPAGYMKWLKRQEPAIVWDGGSHRPPLRMEADWIKAGETVFNAPIELSSPLSPSVKDVHDPAWYSKAAVPTTRDGVMPFMV